MYTEFSSCNICPRNCCVNRNKNEVGFCGATDKAEVCKTALHFGEEPIISGTNGSGTIFFAHCNLGCIYCQNFEISGHNCKGKIYSAKELSAKMLNLQGNGAHNINFVTPTQYMPIIKDSVKIAREMGLNIPVVYNTSGYEKPEIIKNLNETVDIFLTDLKYFSPYYSGKYSKAPDYFDSATDSIKQMVQNVGAPILDQNGILKKGVIIRHLMLPTMLSDTLQVLRQISKHFGDSVYVSLMRQYTPVAKNLPEELCGEVNIEDYSMAVELFEELGLQGFLQERESIGTELIPKWDI